MFKEGNDRGRMENSVLTRRGLKKEEKGRTREGGMEEG